MKNALAKLEKYIDIFFSYYSRIIEPFIGFKSWRNWSYLLSAILLIIWVTVCLYIMAMFSRNIFIETFKWLQFFSLLLIVFAILSRFNKIISASFIAILIFCYAILITYFAKTYTHLTYVFIDRNISDFDSIKVYVTWLLVMVVAVSLSGTWMIHKYAKSVWQVKFARAAVILFAVSVFFLPYNFRNELAVFAQTVYTHSPMIDYYQDSYDRLLKDSADNKIVNLEKWQKRAEQPLPSYLDNIIFLHLESFNGQLATASITPNFYNFASDNYSFPKFYANNIQTIYGQENILCGVPGSFENILVRSGQDKKILCLPEMLKAAGYRTFFAKAGELSFANTGEFMTNIGFSETHSKDLMQVDDPKYVMGYREDVFYNRVFDYLQANPVKRNFIYLAVSGTSHWPFDLPDDITETQRSGLPYPKASNFEERLSNNTYLQDSYLEVALRRIDQMFPEHNYTLMVFGDHSWPIGQHSNNVFIGADCYEENFSTVLTVKVGKEIAYQNKVATSTYSQMDIVPSIAQLFGIDYTTSTYQRSFFAPADDRQQKIITVQPIADQCLNVISLKDNSKLRYKVYYNRADMYDLNLDPMEQSPQLISKDEKEVSRRVKDILGFPQP